MNVLITCIEHKAYLVDHFKEALNGHGHVYVADASRYASALHAGDRGFIIPRGDSPDYFEKLLALCKQYDISVIVSTEDSELPYLSKYAERFKEHGIFACISSEEVVEICFDKYKTYELLRDNGIGVPRTYLWHESERLIRDLNEGVLHFPVLAKPRRGGGSRGIYLLHDKESLLRDMEATGQSPLPEDRKVMYQEYIDSDQYSVHVFSDLNKKPVLVVGMVNIVRGFGLTWQIKSYKDSQLIDLGRRMAESLGSVGPICADVHKRGDEYVVLEINPRFGGCYSVSHYSGADFPGKIIKLAKGENLARGNLDDFKEGVIMLKQLRTVFTSEEELDAMTYRG